MAPLLPPMLPAACCLLPAPQELQMAGINFKAFDLGGHEIARRVWKDYYAKVRGAGSSLPLMPSSHHTRCCAKACFCTLSPARPHTPP